MSWTEVLFFIASSELPFRPFAASMSGTLQDDMEYQLVFLIGMAYHQQNIWVRPTVSFDETMPCKMKKEMFLSNNVNKGLFIDMLSRFLVDAGCNVQIASGDADVMIAKAAVRSAIRFDTVLISEDTDYLVLLV